MSIFSDHLILLHMVYYVYDFSYLMSISIMLLLLWIITQSYWEDSWDTLLISDYSFLYSYGLCKYFITRMVLLDAVSDVYQWWPKLWLFELTRVVNHLLAIGCHIADVGAISMILWVFEHRELFLLYTERLTGIRLHSRVSTLSHSSLDLSYSRLDLLSWIVHLRGDSDTWLSVLTDLTTSRLWSLDKLSWSQGILLA